MQTTTTPLCPAEARQRDGYYAALEVARLLGVAKWTLNHALERGDLPRPTHRYRGSVRRYYSTEDVAVLRRMLEID